MTNESEKSDSQGLSNQQQNICKNIKQPSQPVGRNKMMQEMNDVLKAHGMDDDLLIMKRKLNSSNSYDNNRNKNDK